MPSNPLQVALFARDFTPRVTRVMEEIRELMRDRNDIRVREEIITPEKVPEEIGAELMIVLGGDGAILNASRVLGRQQIPILGINLGRLGFLADLQPEDFRRNLDAIADNQFQVVDHLMIECVQKHRCGNESHFLALNELAIVAGASLRMVNIDLLIDGDKVSSFHADGLIVSTPIGSTAHSLSAGGPILRQTLDAIVVTPICPHTLTNRPLVDSADCEYLLRFPDPHQGMTAVIDGQVHSAISEGDEFLIRKADVTFKLARFSNHSYYHTLHRKLGWGGQPRYQSESSE